MDFSLGDCAGACDGDVCDSDRGFASFGPSEATIFSKARIATERIPERLELQFPIADRRLDFGAGNRFQFLRGQDLFRLTRRVDDREIMTT